MRKIVAFGIAMLSVVGVCGPAQAQTAGGVDVIDEVIVQPTPFSEETNVVAVDRMLDLEGTGGWLRGGKLPRNLDLSDFEAWVVPQEPSEDGEVLDASIPLTPVGLEPVVRGLPERAEPWNVVVLLDAALASTRTVRWAVGRLADRSEDLTGLGSVTIWLTDGERASEDAAPAHRRRGEGEGVAVAPGAADGGRGLGAPRALGVGGGGGEIRGERRLRRARCLRRDGGAAAGAGRPAAAPVGARAGQRTAASAAVGHRRIRPRAAPLLRLGGAGREIRRRWPTISAT